MFLCISLNIREDKPSHNKYSLFGNGVISEILSFCGHEDVHLGLLGFKAMWTCR
jgi:hypothetical protein